jgi:Putative Flp pilus-assembly TadE/G-like
MRSMLRRLTGSAGRGQILPLTAISLTVLLGMAALAVDVGYWRYQQRLEQTAADSAAIAGANEINYPQSNDVTSAAKADAKANGFTDGAANTTILVNWPPQSGPNQNNKNAVEVIVTELQPKFFSTLFPGKQAVSARAVALLSPVNAPCITVLKGSITGDLTLNGGGRGGITTSPLCGIAVNGGLSVTGQANVTASYITYTGNGPSGGSYPDGAPEQSVAPIDPCQKIAGCAYLAALPTTRPELFTSSSCLDEPSLPANPLPPGHYCTAISTNVTLYPGLFVFDQGPPTGTLAGTGVTIYNNCTSGSCNTTLSGGNVNNSIVAPTTGPTAGMVYYQPPSLQNAITVNGAPGTVQQMGGIYAPGANFTFDGQLPTLSFLVAGTIRMNGGGISAGSTLLGQPRPTDAVLVE